MNRHRHIVAISFANLLILASSLQLRADEAESFKQAIDALLKKAQASNTPVP